MSRSEEMLVNLVESWLKRSSTTVARSSDGEASVPCHSNDVSDLCLYIDGCDVQGEDCGTFDESVISWSLLILRSAMLRLTSFPASD